MKLTGEADHSMLGSAVAFVSSEAGLFRLDSLFGWSPIEGEQGLGRQVQLWTRFWPIVH